MSGDYVVYWMTAFRRTEWNYALQRAAQWSEELKKPLIIFEPLRVGYRWANDRMHQFVVAGMRDNAIALQKEKVTYYPYLEKKRGDGAGLIEALATKAAVIVGDEYPCFFLKHLPKWFASRAACRYEIVDSNGLMPLRVPDKIFTVAHSYRRFMQKQVETVLSQKPLADTLSHFRLPTPVTVPKEILRRWPMAKMALDTAPFDWSDFDIDHSVAPTDFIGGRREARRRWQNFLTVRSIRYDEDRNHPDSDGSSHLSPYLHFGHISSHEMFFELMEHETFNAEQLARPNGKVNGFWNLSPSIEAFLDQLLTWREIGFNQCFLDQHYDSYRSLPSWVRASLQ
jgi:deoxyribodipyrimidine photo-lyase